MKKRLAIAAVVVAALVLAIAASAYAATSGNGSVDVTASANSALVMSLTANSVDFGAQDPGSTVTQNSAVTVSVSSNAPFTTSKTITDGTTAAGPMGLATAGFPVSATPIAANSYSYPEDYSINIPWSATPGASLGATVLYEAVQ